MQNPWSNFVRDSWFHHVKNSSTHRATRFFVRSIIAGISSLQHSSRFDRRLGSYDGAYFFFFFLFYEEDIFNPSRFNVDFTCPLVVIFRVRQQRWHQGSTANVDPCLITDRKKIQPHDKGAKVFPFSSTFLRSLYPYSFSVFDLCVIKFPFVRSFFTNNSSRTFEKICASFSIPFNNSVEKLQVERSYV